MLGLKPGQVYHLIYGAQIKRPTTRDQQKLDEYFKRYPEMTKHLKKMRKEILNKKATGDNNA